METKVNRREVCRLLAGAAVIGTTGPFSKPMLAQSAAKWPTPQEAREIAKEAYIYAFPIVQNYLSIYQLALDPRGSQYKGPVNEVHNVARVFTPADTAIVTPNSDTPYSYLIMDLRAEPIVVTLPAIEKDRYYSLQLVDLYTNNVDYLGTREDGNGGGKFMITGPGWHGETPPGIKRVAQIATPLMFSQFRTQLFNAEDIDKVKEIQSGYLAQPLSTYLQKQPASAPPKIDYPSIDRKSFDSTFWQYTNFLLQFCPVLPSESVLRERFERIGIKAGAPWPPPDMPQLVVDGINVGMKDSQQMLRQDAIKLTTSIGLFGTPQQMAGKFKERALGALAGIYGNTPEEAVYPTYQTDGSGRPLDASKFNYALTFAPGALPPVNAFWSITMYDRKTQFLVENPLNRYLINSVMLPELKKNPDGGITLYLQHKSPGPDREANWLPAPNGTMGVVMRLYLPKAEVLKGAWKQPSMQVT